MDMRDIFSANAADFSVPMRNSSLFPACRAYAMPVAKSPFEVFRKASISAAKQLRLSNKGNKIHFLHTASPPRGNALAETFISPESCHARQCRARRFPGLFVPHGKPINQI